MSMLLVSVFACVLDVSACIYCQEESITFGCPSMCHCESGHFKRGEVKRGETGGKDQKTMVREKWRAYRKEKQEEKCMERGVWDVLAA